VDFSKLICAGCSIQLALVHQKCLRRYGRCGQCGRLTGDLTGWQSCQVTFEWECVLFGLSDTFCFSDRYDCIIIAYALCRLVVFCRN